MTRSSFRAPIGAGVLALLAGCATRPAVVVVPPPIAVPAAEMPAGGVPGMMVPARLADGDYPTPSRDPADPLSPDAAVWHLRAALNVAALVCRGEGDPVAAGYNAMLTGRKAALAAAEARYALAWKARGDADGYDAAMTRLYNFYGQSFARAGFCAAAATTLAGLTGMADAELPGAAPTALARLDRPFTDFFAAYDAWRSRAAPPPPIAPATRPRIEVDPAIFRMP